MSASFNRTGIGAEQDRQDVIKLAAQMKLASQVARAGKPKWHQTSYLLIAKLAHLDRVFVRRSARPSVITH